MKHLINKYGRAALNSLTKYPSIPTFHVMGERGRLTDALTHDFGDDYTCTEKADGTNVRILLYQGRIVLGSREELLHLDGETFFNPSMDIVEKLMPRIPVGGPPVDPGLFTVLYGELFGGGVGPNWKQYGDAVQFRLFDGWDMNHHSLHLLLSKSTKEISSWRESDNGGNNQPFFATDALEKIADQIGFDTVEPLDFHLYGDRDHGSVMAALDDTLPRTLYGAGKSEGVVIRSNDRSKIAKIRFEDYQRTLRNNQ